MRAPNSRPREERKAETPELDWMRKNALVDDELMVQYQPTNHFRWSGRTLEQKWIISEMQYNHKWVAVRKRSPKEKL